MSAGVALPFRAVMISVSLSASVFSLPFSVMTTFSTPVFRNRSVTTPLMSAFAIAFFTLVAISFVSFLYVKVIKSRIRTFLPEASDLFRHFRRSISRLGCPQSQGRSR